VEVRLLVWFDLKVGQIVCNMPGHSNDTSPWYFEPGSNAAKQISAQHSVAMLKDAMQNRKKYSRGMTRIGDVRFERGLICVPVHAREEYCHSWFKAAFSGLLDGVRIRTRGGDRAAIARSLETEPNQQPGARPDTIERQAMIEVGTHHQKPILIDFAHKDGGKAVGYVMGLNSVTDYWDTDQHCLDDVRREQGGQREAAESLQDKKNDPGFRTFKPYRDYACRIEGGSALIALYQNFVNGWDTAAMGITQQADKECTGYPVCKATPPALLRQAEPGQPTVQIVRTQPDEGDRSIKDAYWQATIAAANASGYLYIENQYFQYEDWCKHLLAARRAFAAQWKAKCKKTGKCEEDMPLLHVFIVIPAPERDQMVPRTHDALATLGQHEGMTGQNKMIEDANKLGPVYVRGDRGTNIALPQSDVVRHANSVAKPAVDILKDELGLKVSTVMLVTCAVENARYRYREIYIHSKLMLAGDVFFTLGSANLNQRSMVVDSEINISAIAPALASGLRSRIFSRLTGGITSGGSGSRLDIVSAFKEWMKLKKDNSKAIKDGTKMTGIVTEFGDKRSQTMRLG
jgi:phosphatidylserine/phosphatidylglycerophosphate/cardiolipin synthase-like enzyme